MAFRDEAALGDSSACRVRGRIQQNGRTAKHTAQPVSWSGSSYA